MNKRIKILTESGVIILLFSNKLRKTGFLGIFCQKLFGRELRTEKLFSRDDSVAGRRILTTWRYIVQLYRFRNF